MQRIHAAISPPGESQPGWRTIGALAGKLGLALDYTDADDVFAEASARHAFLKGAVWGPASQPVQLRFGESRG